MHCDDAAVRNIDGGAIDGEPRSTADHDVDLLGATGVVVLGELVMALDDELAGSIGRLYTAPLRWCRIPASERLVGETALSRSSRGARSARGAYA
jgi:hypothetical protein